MACNPTRSLGGEFKPTAKTRRVDCAPELARRRATQFRKTAKSTKLNPHVPSSQGTDVAKCQPDEFPNSTSQNSFLYSCLALSLSSLHQILPCVADGLEEDAGWRSPVDTDRLRWCGAARVAGTTCTAGDGEAGSVFIGSSAVREPRAAATADAARPTGADLGALVTALVLGIPALRVPRLKLIWVTLQPPSPR